MTTITLEETRVPAAGVVRGRVSCARAIELAVLWETEGKGDTDLGVVFFRELTAAGEHAFEARLPLAPLSYDGAIVKIRWLVRARSAGLLGEDAIVEAPFTVAPIG